jgi:hypothetical protein
MKKTTTRGAKALELLRAMRQHLAPIQDYWLARRPSMTIQRCFAIERAIVQFISILENLDAPAASWAAEECLRLMHVDFALRVPTQLRTNYTELVALQTQLSALYSGIEFNKAALGARLAREGLFRLKKRINLS